MSARTYTLQRVQTTFVRVGYALSIFNADGSRYAVPLPYFDRAGVWFEKQPIRFYGHDGRKVRAEAIAFAKRHNAKAA